MNLNIDLELVKTGCELSELAYHEDNSDAIRVHSRLTSTTAYIIKDDHMDYVVFRGTQQMQDWFINLSAFPLWIGRWAHGGFALAQKSIFRKIKKHLDRDKPVALFGHSMGGAIAEITAYKLKWDSVHMVTYGKPNVWLRSKKPRMSHLKTQISVVAGDDLITKLPAILYAPDSGQAQIWLGNNSQNYINPTQEQKEKDRNSFIGSVNDHFMTKSYLPRINDFVIEEAVCASLSQSLLH